MIQHWKQRVLLENLKPAGACDPEIRLDTGKILLAFPSVNEVIFMSQKRLNNLDGLVVTSGVIAKMFGLSTRRIRQLAEEGIIDKLKNGSYELIPTVQKYILHLKTAAEVTKSDVIEKEDYWLEKTLHERTKREIAELELAKMRGTMHKAEDVEAVMTDMLGRMRAKLLAMPSKMAPMLIARNEISVIQDMLEEEIFNILKELSDYEPGLFHGDEYIELDEGEDEDSEEDDTDEESGE